MGAKRRAASRDQDTATDTARGQDATRARPNQQRLSELGVPRVVHGAGGYTYEQQPDGAIVILDGPHGKGSRVEPGGAKAAAWQAITAEIGGYPAQAKPPAAQTEDHGLFQQLVDGADQVGNTLGSFVDEAKETAGEVVQTVKETATDVIHTVKDAASGLVDRVAGWWDRVTGPATGDQKTEGQTTAPTPQTSPEVAEEKPAGDVVTIQRGELTALGEGSDAQTKHVHWPHTDASGVTLGKGYDIGSRSKAQVIADLTAAGMDEAQAKTIAEGAGLTGDAAGAWVNANKGAVGEISRDVQIRLLGTMLDQYTQRAKTTATATTANGQNQNAAGREQKEGKPPGTYVMTEQEWNNLHPAMTELVTDLAYQGGYYGFDRVAKINEALKANNGDQLGQLKAVRALFQGEYMDNYAGAIQEKKGAAGAKETFFGQEVDLKGEYRRNQLRLAYLNHVISSLEAGKTVEIARGPG